MASTELSQSLLDIISSLTQDEIPFKLRCAICNNLAINAFRLPCCDQAICESCQSSLPESCPVCEHNPVSPDLCKPNKALRTTLKAFLRTEEKKREKDRPSATPNVITASTLVISGPGEARDEATISANKTSDHAKSTEVTTIEPATASDLDKPTNGHNEAEAGALTLLQDHGSSEAPPDQNGLQGVGTTDASVDAEAVESDGAPPLQSDMTSLGESSQILPNMSYGMPTGMMPAMGWGGQDFNAMAQFMPSAMGNFQNTMGMPGMGPMTAAQGMFGDYGMNMNNMSNGMNMGFGAEPQMYSNWDSSHNNMYNPTAYSNAMGQDYGTSGYAGYMSQSNGNYSQMQQYPNQNYQTGYYGNGPGYMRGMGRGRGRGYYRGRGGYDGHMHANHYQQNYQDNVSQGPMDQTPGGQTEEDIKRFNDELAPGGDSDFADDPPKDSTTLTGSEDGKNAALVNSADQTDKQLDSRSTGETAITEESASTQLQGIPTIDSIDSAPSHHVGYSKGPAPIMDQGYGRGRGYHRGGFTNHRGGFYNNSNSQGPPIGQGVVGAPVAPRAMREGLPNTSNRGRLHSGTRRTGSITQVTENGSRTATPSVAQENIVPQSPSIAEPKARSPSPFRERSRSISRPQSPPLQESCYPQDHRRRDRSESAHVSDDDRNARKERHRRPRRDDRALHSRSPSQTEGSRRSSRHRDKDLDRKSSHRSYKSRRHHSRSESRHRRHGSTAPETNGSAKYDLASRITNAQRLSKGVPSRHEKSSRKRDRDEREKHHTHDHETDRDVDRDRDRRRDRDKHRDRDRERERGKDRKRSRRDRSLSADESESSRRHSRRSKRSHRDGHDVEKDRSDTITGGPSNKDPHTLEREARNRERLMKEQQRRDAMTSERDSTISRRQNDRNLTGGRRLNYKYEDDYDDMSRVEEEREASRWK